MDTAAQKDVVARLRRARGQLDGVITMIENGRSCRDVATQLSAASKAVEKAGYRLMSATLRECLLADADDREMTPDEIERLFVSFT